MQNPTCCIPQDPRSETATHTQRGTPIPHAACSGGTAAPPCVTAQGKTPFLRPKFFGCKTWPCRGRVIQRESPLASPSTRETRGSHPSEQRWRVLSLRLACTIRRRSLSILHGATAAAALAGDVSASSSPSVSPPGWAAGLLGQGCVSAPAQPLLLSAEERSLNRTHRITHTENGRGWKGPLWVI